MRIPKKYFNIAGPCVAEKHYMLSSSLRSQELDALIASESYFILHAARQSGKTTALIDIVNNFNAGNAFIGLHFSAERSQGLTLPKEGIPPLVESIRSELRYHPHLKPEMLPDLSHLAPESQLKEALEYLCVNAPRPLVVLIDEADCLWGQTMISFLRQLRDGYVSRQKGHPFPHSLALVGLRDIRDYKATLRKDGDTLGTASPFNVIKKSLSLRNFSAEEITHLYGQHSVLTGQVFPTEVCAYAYEKSCGQPWLVNAIACEIVEQILKNDTTKKITLEHAQTAIQNLIIRRDTHIDSLLERLKEDRVRRIVEPIMLGKSLEIDYNSDDCRFVLDLGLLRIQNGDLEPANPIYAEVIGRTLSYNYQMASPSSNIHRWMDEHTIDMNALLKNFQEFWRENADIWTQKWDYKEAAPHLILMGFLQRVVNGGADLNREFASGRKRMDINVRYKKAQYPIELKLYYGPKTRKDGEEQLLEYMQGLGAQEGWLIIFDRRPEMHWDDKITWETLNRDGRILHVMGC